MRPETTTAVRAAGVARALADSRRGADEIASKGGIDLVTATDVACEDAMRAVRSALVGACWYVWQFSSTVAYVYLATGRIAAIVHFATSPVHVAAGCLLVAEAGAVVTDLAGRPWSVASSGVLAAATRELHDERRALLERSR